MFSLSRLLVGLSLCGLSLVVKSEALVQFQALHHGVTESTLRNPLVIEENPAADLAGLPVAEQARLGLLVHRLVQRTGKPDLAVRHLLETVASRAQSARDRHEHPVRLSELVHRSLPLPAVLRRGNPRLRQTGHDDLRELLRISPHHERLLVLRQDLDQAVQERALAILRERHLLLILAVLLVPLHSRHAKNALANTDLRRQGNLRNHRVLPEPGHHLRLHVPNRTLLLRDERNRLVHLSGLRQSRKNSLRVVLTETLTGQMHPCVRHVPEDRTGVLHDRELLHSLEVPTLVP